MDIFIGAQLTAEEKEYLNQETGDVNLIFAEGLDKQEAAEQFRRAEVAFGNIPANWLRQSSNIRWLQLESVGFDEYRTLNWDKLGDQITITNLKGMFGRPVAETALAGILALYRGMNTLALLKEKKQWVGFDLRPQLRMLHEQKVLILGGGSIGSTVKILLEAFRCEVNVFGRTASSGDIYTAEDLDRTLPEYDIVVSCLPETSETKGLLDRSRIKRFKKTALFVNVGRGSVVDEQALTEALQKNRLGGAVLDVALQEPLPEDHPLWECDNTIISQHTAGGSEDELKQKTETFLENLERYTSGEKLINIVNFEKGY